MSLQIRISEFPCFIHILVFIDLLIIHEKRLEGFMQNKKWFKIFIWLMIVAMVGSVFLGLLQVFV